MTRMPDIWLTAIEIADMALPGLPTSERGVQVLADRAGWNGTAQSRPRTGRGGGREYAISLLPVEAQRRLLNEHRDAAIAEKLAIIERVEDMRALGASKTKAIREAALMSDASPATIMRWMAAVEGLEQKDRAAALVPAPAAVAGAMEAVADSTSVSMTLSEGLAAFETLPAKAQAVAEARAAMLRTLGSLERSGLSVNEARAVFAEAWSSGEDNFGIEEYREAVPTVSPPTLKRWQADFRRGGLAALAPKWGAARKGKTGIDAEPEIKTLVEGMLFEHPDCSAKLVMRAMRARFADRDLPSYRSVQRWIEKWKEANAALYLMASSPDGFRSRARLVVGDASENVLRLNQRWEMDSTPNDVMLSDGNRHALIGVIDVWSRRVRLVVARTSSSAGVAACLRKALLDFGVPEVLKCDNGSDYKSRHMARVCTGLEIEQKFCQPFNPQEKPHIERFFRTFSHGLVSLCPGFVGHNVEQRSRIEDRKAFATRLMEKDASPLELRMSAQELQAFCDQWCEAIYEREEHSTLGRTPFEQAQSWSGPVRAISDERALDILLMPAPGDDGTRVVGKKGISLDRWHYTDPVLLNHWRERVQVRLDEEDWGRVLVLSEEGKFICWALCPERMGVSRAEAAAHFRKEGREIEAGYRKIIADRKRDSKAATVAADIMGKAVADASSVVPFPARSPVSHETTALGAASTAAEAKSQPRLPEQRHDVTMADVEKLDTTPARKQPETAADRYRHWLAVDANVQAGKPVSDDETRLWRGYQKSPEYAVMLGMIEEYGLDAMLGSDPAGEAKAE